MYGGQVIKTKDCADPILTTETFVNYAPPNVSKKQVKLKGCGPVTDGEEQERKCLTLAHRQMNCDTRRPSHSTCTHSFTKIMPGGHFLSSL